MPLQSAKALHKKAKEKKKTMKKIEKKYPEINFKDETFKRDFLKYHSCSKFFKSNTNNNENKLSETQSESQEIGN